ncbi:MAG: tetratricopeptide repeat protein [Caldilineaceae bacterium]|nr:tetratricopeptide repeat protein [Caldilineaceae bacterium]
MRRRWRPRLPGRRICGLPQQFGDRTESPVCPERTEADLEAAIGRYEEAVEATPAGSPDLPSRLNNLGNGLSARFARSGREADLDAAIGRYEEAVEATPAGSPHHNLGTGLSDRFARSGREGRLGAMRRRWGHACRVAASAFSPQQFGDRTERPVCPERTGSDLEAAIGRRRWRPRLDLLATSTI